jgi:hypothetical protein
VIARLAAACLLSCLFPGIALAQTVPFRSDFTTAADLDGWTLLAVPGWYDKWRRIEVTNGALVIQPKAATWYQDNVGGHLYREVSGDFIITTRVAPRGLRSDLPLTQYSLAGLFIRAPRQLTARNWQRGRENWLFLSAGSATSPGNPQLEVKTTRNSSSDLRVIDNPPGGPQDIRIARRGAEFHLLQRRPGGQWRELEVFSRPDMPQTLWAGVTAYSDWGSSQTIYPDFERNNASGPPTDNADLVAWFDFIDIRPLTPGASLTAE